MVLLSSPFLPQESSASSVLQNVIQLNQTVQTSTKALADYYKSVNALRKDLYIEELRFDPTLQLGDINEINKDDETALRQLAPETIEARIKALAAIGSYTRAMAELANSDAAEQTQVNINGAGEQITSISSSLNNLAKNKSLNNPVSQYATPIAQLVALTVKYWMNGHRQKILIDATNSTNQKNMDAVFNLLESDLKTVHGTLLAAYALKILVSYTTTYNDLYTRAAPTDAEKLALAVLPERISLLYATKQASKRVYDIENNDPSRMVKDMHKAFDALCDYVQHGRKDQKRLATLVSNLDAYTADTKEIATTLEKLAKNHN